MGLAERVAGRWIWVVGKGGVGKTTVAAALAVARATAGERVLLFSTDPAHSLGDALGVALGPEPAAVPTVPRLEAFELDPERERQAFLQRYGAALFDLLERGAILDRTDVDEFFALVAPVVDELATLHRCCALLDEARTVIVDTAPSGQSLRLFDPPAVVRRWLAAFAAMEAKHRTVVEGPTSVERSDEVPRTLAELAADLDRLENTWRHPARTTVLLVASVDAVAWAEAARTLTELRRRGLRVTAVVANRATAPPPALPPSGTPVLYLPPWPGDPVGADALRALADAVADAPATAPPLPTPRPVPAPFRPPPRSLAIVAGKGGVGKSTVAAALALAWADSGRRVHLLSTDPAGSLGDVFGIPVHAQPCPLPGTTLTLQQLDADAAWVAFRAAYEADVANTLTRLLGSELDARADRAVFERLVNLVPPGFDELLAVLDVVEQLENNAAALLVLDPAPTGHLLRFLAMPGTALAWVHAALRLLLQYRRTIGLGPLAQRLLRVAEQLQRLRAWWADPERTLPLIVAAPEALVVPETERLVFALRSLPTPRPWLLVNRWPAAPSPSEARHASALRTLADWAGAGRAPRWPEGPRGAAALRSFATAWERWNETAS